MGFDSIWFPLLEAIRPCYQSQNQNEKLVEAIYGLITLSAKPQPFDYTRNAFTTNVRMPQAFAALLVKLSAKRMALIRLNRINYSIFFCCSSRMKAMSDQNKNAKHFAIKDVTTLSLRCRLLGFAPFICRFFAIPFTSAGKIHIFSLFKQTTYGLL